MRVKPNYQKNPQGKPIVILCLDNSKSYGMSGVIILGGRRMRKIYYILEAIVFYFLLLYGLGCYFLD